MRTRLSTLPLWAKLTTAAAVVAGTAFGGLAIAGATSGGVTYHGCETTALHGGLSRLIFDVYDTKTPTCPSGSWAVSWNQQGPAGQNGQSAVTSITAATALTNWPDTGGAGDVWALDNFTRTLSVTVEDQVNNSHCNGAPACYAVFGTISDVGTSVPQDGVAAPNNSLGGTITAANITGISTKGEAGFQFYATSNQISASNVPASDDVNTDGKDATTTDWGELAFPSGTQFFGATLTAYDWNYTAAVSYSSGGTALSCTQIWNDQVNPGDGQGANDGNITGTCPTT